MTQDLERRMRELCKRIGEAPSTDFEGLIADLKLLLQEHTLKLENLITAQQLLMNAATSIETPQEPPGPKLKTA